MLLGTISLLLNLVSWGTGFGVVIMILYSWVTGKLPIGKKINILIKYLGFTILDIVMFIIVRFLMGGGTYSGSIVNAVVSAGVSLLIMFIRTEKGSAWIVNYLKGSAGL